MLLPSEVHLPSQTLPSELPFQTTISNISRYCLDRLRDHWYLGQKKIIIITADCQQLHLLALTESFPHSAWYIQKLHNRLWFEKAGKLVFLFKLMNKKPFNSRRRWRLVLWLKYFTTDWQLVTSTSCDLINSVLVYKVWHSNLQFTTQSDFSVN